MAACAVGCTSDPEYLQFNAENQSLPVEVLPLGEPEGDPAELELVSNLSLTIVGDAVVDPASGPVGTLHHVSVILFDEFEGLVDRVTVQTVAEPVADLDGDGEDDSRGREEHEMRQDSADPGAWAVSIQSLGSDDERRSDTFTIMLWQDVERQSVEPGADGEGS